LLTADLAQVRRRGDRLSLRPLSAEERVRALQLAEAYLGLASAHLGGERGQLLEALRGIPLSARDRRLGAGLAKLVIDRCEFEPASEIDAAALRADLFTRATTIRRQPATAGDFDRQAVVVETAAAHGLTPEALEQALYADLPEAHRLRSLKPVDGPALLAAYEAAGVSAVLLRATQVRVQVQKAAPGAFRALFSKLKFLRLLFRIEPLPAAEPAVAAGYEITIDGPFSLFESVSRYGLALALAYPAISACGKWSLEADVRWGKERRPLVFVAAGSAPAPTGAEPSALPDDVAQLLDDLERAHADGGRWRPRVAQRVIHLPGAGTVVPDLELVDAKTGRTVLVEVLGFWSREAVWRRVELAERGLPEPMVFAAGKHLRVSEEALPDTLPSALYIYKRRMSVTALLDRAQAVVERTPASGG
jgi:uncharacterized protein